MADLYLHLCDRSVWEQARGGGADYRPARYESEGFIHLSTAGQLLDTANRHYRGATDLVALVIDAAAVDTKVVFERLGEAVEPYPHLYGTLPLTAVVAVIPLEADPDGRFTRPPDFRSISG